MPLLREDYLQTRKVLNIYVPASEIKSGMFVSYLLSVTYFQFLFGFLSAYIPWLSERELK